MPVGRRICLPTGARTYCAGQRVTRVQDEVVTHFYYSGSALLFTTVNEYVLQTQNILDPSGTIVASKRFEGQAATGQDPYADDYFFYRYDIRGSVTNIVDGEGSIVKSYDYDEFGVTTSTGDTFFNEVTFTGSVADASGLLYMNARYYNPATARFLSQDSYTGSASVPWTQHLYAYCNNNPVNMVDPTGHEAETSYPKGWLFWPWKKRIAVYRDAHNAVQVSIAETDLNIVMEKVVTCSNGRRGRVDLLNLETGEIWEVKNHNDNFPMIPRALALMQLSRYTGATVVSSKIDVKAPLHPSTTQFQGQTVMKTEDNSVFNVEYWSTIPGVIEYAFWQAEQEPAREQAREDSPSEVKAPRSIPIIPPIGIIPPEKQGAAVPGYATGYSPGYGLSMGGGGRWWNTMAFRMF